MWPGVFSMVEGFGLVRSLVVGVWPGVFSGCGGSLVWAILLLDSLGGEGEQVLQGAVVQLGPALLQCLEASEGFVLLQLRLGPRKQHRKLASIRSH